MKKLNKILSLALVFTIMLTGISSSAPVFANKLEEKAVIERIAGKTRIQTAIEASKKTYEKSDTVILVSYDGLIDALTATILAYSKDAPLLITYKDSVPKDIKDELKRLGTKNIMVIGGKNVVSEKVISDLEAYSVKRIAGLNRAETAEKIAKEVNSLDKHVFLALGYERFVDALAIGPASAINKSPVLLTHMNTLPKETLMAIKDMKITHITIVGGESAVSKDIVKELEKLNIKIDRISGKNREETAIKIASKYFPDKKAIIIANGWTYADALVGGYMGAKFDSPILLTRDIVLASATRAYIEKIIEKAYILGGINVISEKTFKDIMEALKKPPSKEIVLAREAVIKAEKSKLKEDIDSAKILVNALTNVAEKNALKIRLDAVAKDVDDKAAAKIVRDKINLLPEVSKLKLTDKSQVSEVRAAYNALSSIQKLLVENINKLKEREDKITELESSQTPETPGSPGTPSNPGNPGTPSNPGNPGTPQESQELVKARAAVIKAEGSRLQADINSARTLVNALPPGDAKINLQARLDAIVALVASSDASLNSLKINGTAVEGFASDALSYNVKLAPGTSDFPTIEAQTKDSKAIVEISSIKDFPWSANVVVTAENGVTIQTYTINFTIDQAAPSGLIGVAPTTFGGNDGKIIGTTNGMEYRILSEQTWTAVTGTEITGLSAGYYDVRYAAKIGFNEGLAATIGIQPGPNQDQGSPTEVLTGVAPTTFDAADGKITGTTTAMEYLLGGVWTPVTGPEITGLSVGWYDVRYAAKPGFNAGKAATIQVPAPAGEQQGAPSEALIGIAPTNYGGNDGRITGTTTAMEYRVGEFWIPVTGAEITGLATGWYDVRYAARPGFEAGPNVTIGVPEGPKQGQAAPAGLVGVAPTNFGGKDGKITGTTTAMEYLLEGVWTPVEGTEITGLAAGWYDVRYTAKAGFNEGVAATIGVPEAAGQAQAAPTNLSAVYPSTFGGADGKILGTASSMEYRTLIETTWKSVTSTEITGLSRGYYFVRYSAKPGYDASEDISVEIKEAEASLNAVTVDGVSLAGFATDKLSYNIELPSGTVSVPVVMASALDGNAPVVITAAASLPGQTTILVTAQDGVTTKTYTINFRLINQIPLGLIGVEPTTPNGTDGKIRGATSEMEYKLTSESNWTLVEGTEITGLSPGSYDVRYAAKAGYNLAPSANVIVPNKGAGKLIFTFDDGWKDTITLGKTILDKAGYKATVYVNKDLTQIAEYKWSDYHVANVMDYDDLRVLYKHGWDISNHSANHLDFRRNADGKLVDADDVPLPWQTPEEYGAAYPELDPKVWFTEWYKKLIKIGSDPESVEIMREVYLDNQNWLSNSELDGLGKDVNGVWTPGRNLNMPLSAYHVAYPSGLYSPELIAMLKEIGAETGRATIETGIKNNIPNPVTDFFNLPVQYVESEMINGTDENLADVLESIQYAVNNGTTVILMLHRVGPAGDLFVIPESLEAIVNYAKTFTDAGTLDVMTISQWYNMMK